MSGLEFVSTGTAGSAGGSAAEVAQVGVTEGFDWVAPFTDGGSTGIQLVKTAGVVFAFGYAYYPGEFTGGNVFSVPAGWEDPNGTDLALFANADATAGVTGYTNGAGIMVATPGAGVTLPEDGYLNFQTFWVTAEPG